MTTLNLVERLDAAMPPVVQAVVDRDPMTELGQLLVHGLPDEGEACATGCNRPNAEKPKPLYSGVVQYPPPADWYVAIENCRIKPSDVVADRRDYEVKADLEPLEFLLEYRRLLAVRLAPLSAMHRHAGKWDELRKAIRSKIKMEIRKDPKAFGLGPNVGNDPIEDAAGADERYLDALRIAYREAREYEDLSDELARLEHRIEARKVANMQAIKEMGLQ